MTDNLFNNVSDETPKLDDNKNYFEALVGEGLKFKTKEDLAKGKAYSDSLIEIYERKMDAVNAENARLLEESRTRARLEEIADRIASRDQQLASSEIPPAKEDREPKFDPNQLDSLLDDKLTQFELRKKERENFNLVQNKLKERFGDNYQRNLQQQVEQLGLTTEDINALAKKSPTAFFKTMGLDQPPQREGFQTPPRSARNDNFTPQGTPKRTWSYYQGLKKQNPQLFYDRKTNIQMQKDLMELGDEFKDGDYHALGDF